MFVRDLATMLPFSSRFKEKLMVFGLNQSLFPGSASVCITLAHPTTSPPLARNRHFKIVYLSVQVFVDNTFFWWWTGVKGRPLSDRVPAVLALSHPILPLAAVQKDVSAVEAQVVVGFATMPFTAELQPQ